MNLKIKLTIVCVIFIALLIGCSDKEDGIIMSQKNIQEVLSETEYYKNPYFIYNKNNMKILKIADLIIEENGEFISIDDKSSHIDINKPANYRSIHSLGLSYDKKYLCVEIAIHEGTETYIVNLNTCEYNMINDRQTIKLSEDVATPRWNPNSNMIA